jgi:hypothetical protein
MNHTTNFYRDIMLRQGDSCATLKMSTATLYRYVAMKPIGEANGEKRTS